MKSNLLLKLYIGFSILYLLVILLQVEQLAWFMKPLLLPFLLLAVYSFDNFQTKKLLLTALIFSWIGDIILLYSDRGELYFIFGLIAFLLSHIVYIIVFSKQIKAEISVNKSTFWIGSLFIIGYFVTMVTVLLPKLGDLKLPVVVYAIVITTMLFIAFKGKIYWKKPDNIIVFIGAVFFVCSDSILAFDKFYKPLPFATFFIMSTYIIAQYLIVRGILKLNQKK